MLRLSVCDMQQAEKREKKKKFRINTRSGGRNELFIFMAHYYLTRIIDNIFREEVLYL